jgi:hypothetical protein
MCRSAYLEGGSWRGRTQEEAPHERDHATLILGTTYPVFIGVTLVLMCGCAILMGGARQLVATGAAGGPLCAAACDCRPLLIYGLFNGDIKSITASLSILYCILLAALVTYRFTLAGQMVRQYPWLYRRFLIFGWRKRREAQ